MIALGSRYGDSEMTFLGNMLMYCRLFKGTKYLFMSRSYIFKDTSFFLFIRVLARFLSIVISISISTSVKERIVTYVFVFIKLVPIWYLQNLTLGMHIRIVK